MSEANAEQRAHWNERIGPRWVGLSDEMDTHLEGVAGLVLARAAAAPGEAVLEIGSGTGSMAVRLAEAVKPGGHVLGLDISRPMLEAAEARVRRSGISNVTFRLADAQVDALPSAAFDLAFSRFGVMFFEDPAAAFANIRSAVKPTGRLAFICWGPLKRNPHWVIPWGIATRHLGRPDPRPPHAPGPMAFDDPDYVRDILTRGGWRDIQIDEATPVVMNEVPERAVYYAVTIGPAGTLIGERTPDPATLDAIRTEIASEFGRYVRDGRVEIPAQVYVVAARVS